MADNPFRYVGEKLLEPAGPNLWPLAILYFNPETRGLQCAIADVGAELIVGHGRKIGVIMEARARALCRLTKSTPGSAREAAPATPVALHSPLPPADSAETEWSMPNKIQMVVCGIGLHWHRHSCLEACGYPVSRVLQCPDCGGLFTDQNVGLHRFEEHGQPGVYMVVERGENAHSS